MEARNDDREGYEIKALDHGFIRYVDNMGTDESVVEAARVSTGRGFVSWESYKRCKKCDTIRHDITPRPGTESWCGTVGGMPHDWQDFPRGDFGILEYMMRNGHTTPFEMCELKIQVRCPMDVWRQWIRQRTASVNEYSTRYSEAIDATMATAPDRWRVQGATNRQGSSGYLPAHIDTQRLGEPYAVDGAMLSDREAYLHRISREAYEERLAAGVAKEQARKDLPLSTYTEAYWKIDLHNLLKFLGQRLHPHAQEEIRFYARAVAEITKALWPRCYDLFEEHVLYGVRLSRSEAVAITSLAQDGVDWRDVAYGKGRDGRDRETPLLGRLGVELRTLPSTARFAWTKKRQDLWVAKVPESDVVLSAYRQPEETFWRWCVDCDGPAVARDVLDSGTAVDEADAKRHAEDAYVARETRC